MSGYSGRRAPNVSQYIANLNMVASPQDVSLQQDAFSFEDDLAMFTNAQFFDFDLGETVDASAVNLSPAKEEAVAAEGSPSSGFENGGAGLVLDDNYQFASFPGFQKLLGDAPNLVIDPSLKPSSNMPYEATQVATSPGTPSSSTVAATPTQTRATPSSSSSSSRRKSGAVSTTSASLEEASRLAAEEDKRRRNTAASARFRVKKKQREQTLERTAKEMTEKVGQLEARIGQLETENKWLKNLITEKNGSPSSSSSLSRSTAEKKDGVGTAAAAAAGLKP